MIFREFINLYKLFIDLFGLLAYSGVVNISSIKHDFIAIKDKVYLHKQIELRDGLVFMRMKKRAIVRF